MIAAIIAIGSGIVISLAAAAALWIKNLTEDLTTEKLLRLEAEEEVEHLRETIRLGFEVKERHEKKAAEILAPDISDDRAGELLSEPPASPTRNANSRNS